MPHYGIPSIMYLDGATGMDMIQYVMELVEDCMNNEIDNCQNAENKFRHPFMLVGSSGGFEPIRVWD